MKQIMILAALVAAFAGCTSSTSIKWGGKKAVRNPDGAVLTAADGSPYYESEPNVYEDSNWLTKREERDMENAPDADACQRCQQLGMAVYPIMYRCRRHGAAEGRHSRHVEAPATA